MARQKDAAHKLAEERLGTLEREYSRIYGQAAREMKAKQEKALAEYQRELSQRLKALDPNDADAVKRHKKWLEQQAARQAWLDGMADELSESAVAANGKAVNALRGTLPAVIAESANAAAYKIESKVGYDTGFTLVNEEAVRRLVMGGEPLIPEVGITAKMRRLQRDVRVPIQDTRKDMRWNRQKFKSAIMQGILQGESVQGIANRTGSIYGMNMASAIRAARTATTNAENAGRMSSFERAQSLGIDMEIEWLATLDERTRESHREMDGERIKLGEKFSNGLRWPGDEMGDDPSEVWNCRCRADGEVVGFDGERGEWADGEPGERWSKLPDGMTYEEWKAGKAMLVEDMGDGVEGLAGNAQDILFTNQNENGIINMATRGGYEPIDLSDAIEEIESGKTNSLKEWVTDGQLSPERKRVHDGIIDDLLEGKTPTGEQPKMTMLGGGPASGKSSVMNPDTKGNPHAITIDPDDMKKRLPGFAQMAEVDTNAAAFYHEESSALAKRFSEVAYGRHIDAIYDGTGDGSVGSVMKKINAAKANGYRVEAKYVTIDTNEAIRRNQKRYDDAKARGETPRLPPPEMVRKTHAKVTDISVKTAPKFDHIEVWDNNGGYGEQVLIATGGGGKWLKPVSGMESKFEAYLSKGERGIGGFERLADGSYRPKE